MDPLILPLLLIVALSLPLVLGSRRQKRAMAEAQRLHDSLTAGDRVITISGLHATVAGTADEGTVDLEIAPGVRTTWLRAAIREKISEETAEELASDETTANDRVTEDTRPSGASAWLAPSLDDGAHADRS